MIAELNASNLRGRGGAFFPTGRKWSFVPKPDKLDKPHYLVINADESEPGTFKDREIMLRVPFRFLEGALIAAHAIESKHVFIYIRGEYEAEFEVLVAALEQMRGEAASSATSRSSSTAAPAPTSAARRPRCSSRSRAGAASRGRSRPFPAIAGLYASPTAVNNVESITSATSVMEIGGAEYAKLGVESSTGTRVFSLSGNVVNGGNYELPHGFPLRDLINDLGGGIADGRALKAVIPGGSSTVILTADEANRVTLDFDSLVGAGTAIGSAAVIVIDDRCCMVQLAVRVSQFYQHESCGKCTPVPGRHEVADDDPPEDRGRPRHAGRHGPARLGGRADQRQVPLPARRLRRDRRDELLRQVPRRVPGAHRRGRLPVPRLLVARPAARPRRDARPRPGSGARMSELVKVTIDDREVEVPKGTGLVETAAAAGIEIPVFCYEPRLGPPVGACRMCLVEVEGLPKLQAGCSLTAQDGMVVKTAASSEKAAEGQNATLEFILVNHPLDCPVCDKGGECPLQDLTFRYGPGNTRMSFSKITLEKPIPVSPLIALDRERCILCYRCTRFSSDVAEDNQLVARNRGAHTEITTFESDPYRAPFSGNVIELCPVGALTSTQYRFEARPWDIQNVPTVCGLCPVGCNINATVREGKVKRILSRNHPEVDGGWLCDKGRFTYPHLRAEDRITEPLVRGQLGLEPVSWDAALDRAEELLRGAGTRIVTALSGSETVEQAYALARLLRGGLGAHAAVLPESTSDALDAFRLPLSALAAAEIVVVVGDDDVAERAPVVDLWLKAGRRNGAEIVHYGPTGTVPTGPGGAAAALRALVESGQRAGRAAPRLRAGDPRLVGQRRRRRRPARRGRARARLRGQARQRRLPPAGDAERPRRRRGLGRSRRRGRREPRADRPPDRLRRRGRRRPGRARARRAGRER